MARKVATVCVCVCVFVCLFVCVCAYTVSRSLDAQGVECAVLDLKKGLVSPGMLYSTVKFSSDV